MSTPAIAPAPMMPFEEARKRYWARRPWRYDARFHVPPQHIGLVPVFISAPSFCTSQGDDDVR